MKETQLNFVIGQLLLNGEISRNECLRNYISRLSAIIQTLEQRGWVFEPKRSEKDYYYKLLRRPLEGLRSDFIRKQSQEKLI